MINMFIGKDNGIKFRRLDRKRFPVSKPQFLISLKKDAIDQYFPVDIFQQVF